MDKTVGACQGQKKEFFVWFNKYLFKLPPKDLGLQSLMSSLFEEKKVRDLLIKYNRFLIS